MRNERQAKSLQDEINRWKWGIVAAASLAVAAYAAWFGWGHGLMLAEGPSTWGEFGDFLGGLLNPLVAFAAFYWLTRSVQLQKTELEATRTALEESSDAQKQQAQQSLIAIRLNALMSAYTLASNDIFALEQKVREHRSELPTSGFQLAADTLNRAAISNLEEQVVQLNSERDGYRREMREILERYRLPAPISPPGIASEPAATPH